MAVGTRAPVRPSSGPAPAGTRPAPRARLARAALAVAGAGVAFVAARDGSPVGQAARLAAVVGAASLAWAALGREGRARRAAAVFTAGAAATAVGVGIALPHLAKSGPRALTSAGVAALGGGLLLLGGGAITLVRVARGRRRAVVAAALLVAVLVVVWTLGQAVAITNVPRTAVGGTTPADLGLAYRDVTFRTADGVTLSGWYVPSVNGAGIALLHGAGSTRSNVLDHAAVLAGHGFGVVLFDARGHGRSGGRAMDLGWYGDADTTAAVSFLEAQPDVDPGRIAAVGMSMGGEEAVGAAAADDRIRAVVAEGATNRTAADKDWLSGTYGWRGAAQEWIERLVYGLTDLLTAARPPIGLRAAVAAAAPRPVLLVAAGDVAAEDDAARHIRGGSPGTVEVWVAPGAGHTDALDAHPAEWEERVTAFLDRALGPGGPGGTP